jgi:hypothetical protein
MRSPYGFISTGGSAYCTKGGAYWIIKASGSWHLLQMGHPGEGRERRLLGKFRTMTAAADYYRTEVTA